MKTFEMKPRFFGGKSRFFSKNTAPKWLTSENTIRGSTMDDRWFWNDYVLKLKIKENIKTDFHIIIRLT